VQILNIRNSTDTVDCVLFDAPEGFPIEVLRSATNVMVIKVRRTQARCDFEDIPPGTYALAVIHDENGNGTVLHKGHVECDKRLVLEIGMASQVGLDSPRMSRHSARARLPTSTLRGSTCKTDSSSTSCR
jgi:hypothetical protein